MSAVMQEKKSGASQEALDYLDRLLAKAAKQRGDVDDGQTSFNELVAELIQTDRLNITEKQAWLCSLDSRITGIAEIGCKGNGKSFSLMLLALAHCERYGKEARCLVVRKFRDDTEPMQRLMIEILRLAYFNGDGAKAEKCLNKSTGFINPPCGGVLKFLGIETLADCGKVRGGNWNFLGIDECTKHTTDEIFATLRSELRSTTGSTRIVLTGNPTREGIMSVIKQRYCSHTPFVPFIEEDTGLLWIYAPARSGDNPFLTGKKRAEHDAQIRAIGRHDPDLADALITGNLEKLGDGDMFGQVWSPHRNIIAPFVDLPDTPDAEVFISIDHGGAGSSTVALYCCLFHEGGHLFNGEYMPRGSLIVFDEYDDAMSHDLKKTQGLGIATNAERIVEIADQWNMRRRAMIGDDVKYDRGSEMLQIEEYARQGLKCTPVANTERGMRATNIRDMMRAAGTAGNRKPRGLYITRNCRNTLATLPKLLRDTRNQDAVKKDGSDHWYDALGFAANYKREKFSTEPLDR